MSVFRNYLRRNGEAYDESYNEVDESWFVYYLYSFRKERVPEFELNKINDPFEHDHMSKLVSRGWEDNALRFVSTFLCFFVVKPPEYRMEIKKFKDFYIPGFQWDLEKQHKLIEAVRPEFRSTPLETALWVNVNDYFIVREADTPKSAHHHS
jgi:hypothetical protein